MIGAKCCDGVSEVRSGILQGGSEELSIRDLANLDSYE